MDRQTFKKCLDIACGFKAEYGIEVHMNVFRHVLARSLLKLKCIHEEKSYMPLLFEDCLKEHYMFEYCRKNYGGKKTNGTDI